VRLIVGVPKSCHSRVEEFSPSNLHHCNISVSLLYRSEPAPPPVFLSVNQIEEHCGLMRVNEICALGSTSTRSTRLPYSYAPRYSPKVTERTINTPTAMMLTCLYPNFQKALAHYHQKAPKDLYDTSTTDYEPAYPPTFLEEPYKEHGLPYIKIR